MNIKRKKFSYTITTILISVLLAVTSMGQDKGAEPATLLPTLPGANPLSLIGTWEVQATVTNCSGITLQQFSKLVSFNPGGTAIEVSTGAPPAARTTALGIWEHEGRNSFRYALKFFIFTPTGVHAATTNAKWFVTMGEFSNSYTAEGQIQVVPVSGPTQNLCGTETGTRYDPFSPF